MLTSANTVNPDTLTSTLEQTEKQIYGLIELVGAMECKLNGPKNTDECCGRPDGGICGLANHNLDMLGTLSVRLSHISERL